MIIVVEGISAAGKTTYSRRFGEKHCVPEFEAEGQVPGAADAPRVHAEYWLQHNIRRFKAALAIEARHGFAICDTEPFKSHFDWCMARAGFKTMDVFNEAMPLARKAIVAGEIGFADRYLVKHIEADVARAQKEGDKTRRRRRFDMHLALQPHLMDWFEALASVMPERVCFHWPAPENLMRHIQNKTPEENPRRFDDSVLDDLLDRLPG
ncbi:MAG: hypothetical protein KJP27_03500 [Altererythrobacter sp.]|nr:hypothetical protein [Altererythrobacter sp.]